MDSQFVKDDRFVMIEIYIPNLLSLLILKSYFLQISSNNEPKGKCNPHV